MDEPCSALDPVATLAIEDLIAELKKSYTIAIVTHNMQQAARASDVTAFFNLEETRQARPAGRDRPDREDLHQPRPRRRPRTTSAAASAEARPRALWPTTYASDYQEELTTPRGSAPSTASTSSVGSLDRTLEAVEHQDIELAADGRRRRRLASTAATSRCTSA